MRTTFFYNYELFFLIHFMIHYDEVTYFFMIDFHINTINKYVFKKKN